MRKIYTNISQLFAALAMQNYGKHFQCHGSGFESKPIQEVVLNMPKVSPRIIGE